MAAPDSWLQLYAAWNTRRILDISLPHSHTAVAAAAVVVFLIFALDLCVAKIALSYEF